MKPWESNKFLIGQWHRGWKLKPSEYIECKCGYRVYVPGKKLSSRERYNILYRAKVKHLQDCPEAKRMGIEI